jgi:hypothetical protein
MEKLGEFRVGRDAAQKLNEARFASENRPFWSVGLTRGASMGHSFTPVFEPRLSAVYHKPFLRASDPFYNEDAVRGEAPGVFDEFNKISSRFSSIKVVARLVIAPIIREYKRRIFLAEYGFDKISMFDLNTTFNALLANYCDTTAREYTDLTALFSQSLTAAAGVKFSNFFVDEKGRPLSAFDREGRPIRNMVEYYGESNLFEGSTGFSEVSADYLDQYGGFGSDFNDKFAAN